MRALDKCRCRRSALQAGLLCHVRRARRTATASACRLIRTSSSPTAIRGDVRFNTNALGDFVIMRSNGLPVYNFCVGRSTTRSCASRHVIRAVRASLSVFQIKLL